jgi:SAM-dependent methyltransferase
MSRQRAHSSANVLFDLIEGHRVTAVIYTAAQLGLADHLAKGPKTITELAQLCDAHEPSLLRLMQTMVKLGLFTQEPDSKFGLTDAGSYLASANEYSLKAWVLLEGGPLRNGWSNLLETIRTGKTADELRGLGPERFEVLAKTGEAASLFNEAMLSLTRLAVPDLLSAHDFAGISSLMDVGGGTGQLMAAILKKYPSMRGIVFDLPHCAEGARKNFEAAGVANRCEFIGGSFFESVPAAADAIVMKSIIHDWNDARSKRILQNCHQALKPGARLLLIEKVKPEKIVPGGDDLVVFLDDLNMLRIPGGGERTPSEFRVLLAAGDFKMGRVVPTGRYSVIEATAE